MHWKKYMILLLPFLLSGILVLLYLPSSKRYYAFLIGIIFWIVYYVWINFEKNRRKETNEQ